jgi:anaerobic ribonucleoside-triphosphate reductase activating protein
MRLNLAGIAYDSVTDGPGIRLVFFVQGCRHQCPGCHNPGTWDFAGGTSYKVADLYALIGKYSYIHGVTFSGGEPFLQAGPLALLGRQVKEAGYNIVTYTGFYVEEILTHARQSRTWLDLLQVTDILIDGPYLQERRDPSLPYCGSANQRLLHVPATLKTGKPVPWYEDSRVMQ